jgi:hypothetical protein
MFRLSSELWLLVPTLRIKLLAPLKLEMEKRLFNTYLTTRCQNSEYDNLKLMKFRFRINTPVIV